MSGISYAKGIQYEKMTCDYLEANGYTIIDRRFKTTFGEIDIVCSIDETLVFAEVKYRTRINLDCLTVTQQRRIVNAATWFLANNPQYAEYYARFDVIMFSPLLHIPNAFI